MILLLPNLGQACWSETWVPISATRDYWRNTGVFSDLDSVSTLHYTLHSDSPSSNPLLFQPSFFTAPLVSHLWPSITLTKLSRKTEMTVKSRNMLSAQVIINISAVMVWWCDGYIWFHIWNITLDLNGSSGSLKKDNQACDDRVADIADYRRLMGKSSKFNNFWITVNVLLSPTCNGLDLCSLLSTEDSGCSGQCWGVLVCNYVNMKQVRHKRALTFSKLHRPPQVQSLDPNQN